MLEKLRNQERLSEEEERRIDSKIRIIVFAMAAAIILFMIWKAFHGAQLGPFYYGVMLTMLILAWILKNVVATVLRHSLAQRTDAQVSAYLKAAGLDFIAYAGLAWFLLSMSNSNSIIGVAVYAIAITTARRQREVYEEEPEDENGNDVVDGEGRVIDSGDGSSSSGSASASANALPTAANREEREKETEDGSV